MKDINVYAPVLIPTLCRFSHFKTCVESLSQCTGAQNTDLYVALDYPLSEDHVDGHKQIKDYLPSITGFNSVNIIERVENFGYWKNYREALRVVFEKHDRFIFSEDDNVFSKNFLIYVNKGLEKYYGEEKVHSICGYNYPINLKELNSNNYPSYYYSAWGVGEWRHKQYPLNHDAVKSMLKNNKACFKLLFSYPIILSALLSMEEKGDLYDDTTSTALSIVNDLYNIFPKVSKVRNMGHDGSGVHCLKDEVDIYSEQIIDDSPSFEYDDVTIGTIKIDSLDEHFKLPFKSFLKLMVRLIIFKRKHIK